MAVSIADVKNLVSKKNSEKSSNVSYQPNINERPLNINEQVNIGDMIGGSARNVVLPEVSNFGSRPLPFRKVNIDVSPIVIDDVNDKTGRLSSKIEALEDKYNVSVLPFEVTNLIPGVKNLQRHEFLMLNGIKYVSGTTRIVNSMLVESTVNDIKLALENGTPYITSLNTNVRIDGDSYRTIKFNSYELSYILALFRNFKSEVSQNVKGEVTLTVSYNE